MIIFASKQCCMYVKELRTKRKMEADWRNVVPSNLPMKDQDLMSSSRMGNPETNIIRETLLYFYS